MSFILILIICDNISSQVAHKRRQGFGQWMNSYFSLTHKQCHLKSYHSDIKYHMTLISYLVSSILRIRTLDYTIHWLYDALPVNQTYYDYTFCYDMFRPIFFHIIEALNVWKMQRNLVERYAQICSIQFVCSYVCIFIYVYILAFNIEISSFLENFDNTMFEAKMS